MRKSKLFLTWLAVCLTLAVVATGLPAESAQAAGISISLDGRSLASDVAPVMENNRVLVPFRVIAEALGASVNWNNSTQTVTMTKGGTTARLSINNATAYKNNQPVNLDVPARLRNGRTLVPIRFVSEALGANVEWQQANNRVVITTAPSTPPPASLSGSLKLSGSTSVQPLAEELAQAFMKKYPKVSIAITGGGSGVGVKDAAAGSVNIGNASRDLKPEELAQGLVPTVIARDAVAVVVHPTNPVNNLTTEQVRDIFTGKITKWNEVGGPNAPIIVNSRTAPSGTLDFFVEHFLGEEKIAATAKQHASNGLVRQAVAANENAIGFISMGYLDNTVKAPNLDGQKVDMAAARSGAYQVVRNFNMITKGKPTGLAKAFLDWILSPEGQQIVTKEYLPPK